MKTGKANPFKGKDAKLYAKFENSEPKSVVKKEVAAAKKVFGSKATHKDAEKLEPLSMKKKEVANAKKKLKK